MYNDRVITTVLVDPWQQRTWKFRLPENEMIFQNLLRAPKIERAAFDASFKPCITHTRVIVWFNPEPETRFGWILERDLTWNQSQKGWVKDANLIQIGTKECVRFCGLCLLYCPEWYYRESFWPAFLQQIQWVRLRSYFDFGPLDFGNENVPQETNTSK